MDNATEDGKRCCACKEVKARTEFHMSRARADGLQSRCHECSRESVRKWAKDNPEANREASRKSKAKWPRGKSGGSPRGSTEVRSGQPRQVQRPPSCPPRTQARSHHRHNRCRTRGDTSHSR